MDFDQWRALFRLRNPRPTNATDGLLAAGQPQQAPAIRMSVKTAVVTLLDPARMVALKILAGFIFQRVTLFRDPGEHVQ